MAAESGMAPPSFGRLGGAAPAVRRGVCHGHGIDWLRFDALLHALEPTPRQLRLLGTEAIGTIEPETYIEDCSELGGARWRLIKERFYALLRDGATLELPQLERHLLEARQLSAAVARRHGVRTSATGCLSFTDRSAMTARWNTEDTELLQLIGRKRWLVYGRGFEDPLAEHGSEVISPACPLEPLLDVVLEAGDVLELPRGYWHRSIAFDLPSAHLAVSIQAPTLHDYLSWVLARHAPGKVAVRRRLAGEPAQAAADLGAAVEALRETLLDPALLADYRRALVIAERPQPEFELAWFSGQRRLGPDTPLRLATAQAPARSADTLLVNGCAMPMDSAAASVVRELSQQPATTVGALAAALPAIAAAELHDTLMELAAHGFVVIGGAVIG